MTSCNEIGNFDPVPVIANIRESDDGLDTVLGPCSVTNVQPEKIVVALAPRYLQCWLAFQLT